MRHVALNLSYMRKQGKVRRALSAQAASLLPQRIFLNGAILQRRIIWLQGERYPHLQPTLQHKSFIASMTFPVRLCSPVAAAICIVGRVAGMIQRKWVISTNLRPPHTLSFIICKLVGNALRSAAEVAATVEGKRSRQTGESSQGKQRIKEERAKKALPLLWYSLMHAE